MDIKEALLLAKGIRESYLKVHRPPEEGKYSPSQQVVPMSYVRQTRGYIEKVSNQINGCFDNGWYDACAVMMRRLIETLIIEVYEHHGIDGKIKNTNGDFYFLEKLIDSILSETSWNLDRNAKRALPKLKKIGDLSAHSRRYNAHLRDLLPLIEDFRLSIKELVSLANLK